MGGCVGCVRSGARYPDGDAGFSSAVLLVAVVPALFLVFGLCLEASLAAYAWARADVAAHAGADAAVAGGDPAAAATASLSRGLARDADVAVTGSAVQVAVRPPSVVGLGRAVTVAAEAPLAAEAPVEPGRLP